LGRSATAKYIYIHTRADQGFTRPEAYIIAGALFKKKEYKITNIN